MSLKVLLLVFIISICLFPIISSGNPISGESFPNSYQENAGGNSLSDVTSNNGVYASQTEDDANYMNVTFGDVIPTGSTVNSVSIIIEHYESESDIELYANWNQGAMTTPSVCVGEANICNYTYDLYSAGADTESEVDNLNIQWKIERNAGPGDVGYVDYFLLNYSYTEPDTVAPTFSNNGTNSSTPYESDVVKFYSQWNDDKQLDKYIFSWNGTGSNCDIWDNDTAASFQTNNWTNTTKIIPSACEGKVVGFKFYGNDTQPNWNVTEGYINVQTIIRTLDVSLLTPTGGQTTNVIQNNTFNVNATVTCETNPAGYSCGSVNGSVRYNGTTEIKIYNFSGITQPSSTHRADYGDGTSPNPNDLGTEANNNGYTNLSTSNDYKWRTISDGSTYNYQKYRFIIDEAASDIKNLTVLWEGFGYRTSGVSCLNSYWGITLSIWNFTSSSWVSVGSHSEISDTNIIQSYTSNINQFVNSSGYLFLYVRTGFSGVGCEADVYTDFVKVEVNHTAMTAINTTTGATPFYITAGFGNIFNNTYDFVGINNPSSTHKAEDGSNNGPPYFDLLSGTEADNSEYDAIESTNDARWTTTTDLNPYQQFMFKINEDVNNISKIDVLWEGYGSYYKTVSTTCDTLSHQAYLKIWNFTSDAWVSIGYHTSSSDSELTASYTTGITDLINASGYLYLVIYGHNVGCDIDPYFLQSDVRTDYVYVNISLKTNTQLCGSLTDSEQCQLNWTVNATGSLNSIYAIDANFNSNMSQVSSNNTPDAYVKIIPPLVLKDQIVSPCLNSSTDNDYCNPTTNPTAGTGASPGSAFNITFRFVNSTSYSGTVNQTINLKWDYSTNPTANEVDSGSSYLTYTTDCTGESGKPILYGIYNDSCGNINCAVEGDGDVRLENSTSDQSSYDGNITFDVRFCSGTAGQTFDISPYVKVSTDGSLTLDSSIQVTPAVIEAWTSQFATGGDIQSSPALGNISVDEGLETLIGSNDYYLYAINSTGNQLWNYETSGEIYGAPALADVNSTYEGLEVIFGSCDNKVYVLNNTGDLVWSYTTGGCIGPSPDVDDVNNDGIDDVVISSFDDNKTWAFSGNNGTELWNFTANGTVWSSPVIANLSSTDYRVYVGSYDGNMHCINATNGSLIWNYSAYVAGKNNWIESSGAVGNVTGSDHLSVVFGSYNGKVYALNASDGTLDWSFTVPGASPSIISSPVIVDVNNDTEMDVVIGSNTAHIFALNGTDGSQLWNYTIPTGGRADSSPAVIDVNNDTYNDVIFGSSDNYIYALNGIGGSLIWNHSIGGSIWGSPAINDINNGGGYEILVGSNSKNVTAIDPPGSTIPSTWDMWGGDSARTRLHDNVPPENQILDISDTTVDPLQPITMNSLWRDSYSDIAYATLDEDSSGNIISHTYELNNPDWVNYTFSGLRNDQTVNFVIRVYDSYGNVGTVSRSFTVGLTREIICGDGICDYGEATTCPQDCPRGEESEGGPTERPTEELPALPSVIEEVMKRVGEKLPEAAKNLVPLVIAVVLMIIIIYVFVI